MHKNWELITGDPDILALIKSFIILFLYQPVQDNVPRVPGMSKAQRELVQAEEETMLKKRTISQIDQIQGEFISLLFFVERKDGDQRSVINLKN